MRYLILISLIFLGACGFRGNQKITLEGNPKVDVVVTIGLLDYVMDVCEKLLLPEDFLTEQLYNQAIAECALENLQLVNISPNIAIDAIDSACSIGHESLLEFCEVIYGSQ